MTRTIDPESFLSGSNAPYIIDLFRQYRASPDSVTPEWQHFFKSISLNDAQIMLQDDRVPEWSSGAGKRIHKGNASSEDHGDLSVPTDSVTMDAVRDSLRALMMIRAYRVRGHLMAKLDPLHMNHATDHPELLPQSYGFSPDMMNNRVYLDRVLGVENATVGELYDKVRHVYCQTVGFEFMHMQDPDKKSWIQERVENTPVELRVDDADRLEIMQNLIQAESFEHFLDVKYPGTKRFGLEGGESLIPALETLISRLANEGVKKVVFGTAHRGRLNILANVIKKPIEQIFAHFKGGDVDPKSFHGTGDVKYHLGYSSVRSVQGRDVALTLMPNPSHLEAVDPIVLGKVRADQDLSHDVQRRQTVPVMLHGDAAFAGQGLVAEVLDLSGLKGYTAGGTIHIIINNQIGFTTSPPLSRTSQYTSDIAKAIQAPIFHVNADDPEAVMWAMRLAVDYYRQFSVDVVLDLICYRRHGHNEIDEPSFTQPLMYKKIAEHPSTCKIYAQSLIDRKLLSADQIDAMTKAYENDLQAQLESLTDSRTKTLLAETQWLQGVWKGIKVDKQDSVEQEPKTGVPLETLKTICKTLVHVPENLQINSRLSRVLKAKQQMIEDDSLDWATGEALAIGSLLLEDKWVRLSGQDVSRGTFSHRHAVWVDQKSEESYIPLNHIGSKQRHFEVVDSPLAEASVLGFEYGYTLANPQALVMWEAQFGDFANGAQVIIDQFISSAEHKWNRLSGLVMLLPHGYEGQGPEHSSARLERYLQLCAENNMRVVNCSTPANYFHVLRRQLSHHTRKPLIVMSPKTLLRHKLATSPLSAMASETHFHPVFDEVDLKKAVRTDNNMASKDVHPIEPSKVKRVILCSGKIYYELLNYRRELQNTETALLRLEQYYPFPHQRLVEVLAPYRHAEFYWCQEEPKNMGAWSFLDRQLEAVLKELGTKNSPFMYIGRNESASPATGNMYRHAEEQSAIMKNAFDFS